MQEWFRSEFGGVLLSALGYALRALTEANRPTWGLVGIRILASLIAGVVVVVAFPLSALPDHWRVLLLVLVGAATPEVVRVGIAAGLRRLDKEADRGPQ